MHALHEETNAKLRANIFAKNDVLEGVDMRGDGSAEGDGGEGWLRTRVLRVLWEGMGRGNGESIIANAMTSRHTNVIETNQRPAFVAYRTIEVRMHPHA